MIQPGRYQHYKGGTYTVLLTAMSAESGKPMVVYLNEVHGSYYVRELSEFTEKVKAEDGQLAPRFKLIA